MPKAKPEPDSAAARLKYFEDKRQQIVQNALEMVEIESPSDNKRAVDRLGRAVAAKFAALGGRTQFHKASDFGDHLQVDFAGARGKPVLLLGPYDTVYPLGSFATMPCRVGDGRVWGPGVLDMKSGIALMLAAIEGLKAWHGALLRPITVLLV